MSGKPSRDKGARGEREVSKIMAEALSCDARRVPMSGAGWMKGDLANIPGLHVEVKRAEKLQLTQWLEQVDDQCPDDKLGVLVYRKSREPWRIVMRLSDFLPLWRLWMEQREV